MLTAYTVGVILSQLLLLARRVLPNEKPGSNARKSEHPPIVAKTRGSRIPNNGVPFRSENLSLHVRP